MDGVDALIAACWAGLLGDLAWRQRGTSRAPALARAWSPPMAVRGLVLATLLAGVGLLESMAPSPGAPAAVRAAGCALAVAGLALHLRARRALGRHWSATILVRADHALVTGGPYAHVRHPLYLAVLLLAAGTLLAHPSAATLALAVGLAVGVGIKARREDRAMHAVFGAAWEAWAAAVPALRPRLRPAQPRSPRSTDVSASGVKSPGSA